MASALENKQHVQQEPHAPSPQDQLSELQAKVHQLAETVLIQSELIASLENRLNIQSRTDDTYSDQDLKSTLIRAGLSETRAEKLDTIASEKLPLADIREILLSCGTPEDFKATNDFRYFKNVFDFSSLDAINSYANYSTRAENYSLASYFSDIAQQELDISLNDHLNKENLRRLLPKVDIPTLRIDNILDFTDKLDDSLPNFPIIVGAFGGYSSYLKSQQYSMTENFHNYVLIGTVLNDNTSLSTKLSGDPRTTFEFVFMHSYEDNCPEIMHLISDSSHFPMHPDTYLVANLIDKYLENKNTKKELYKSYLIGVLKKYNLSQKRCETLLDCFFSKEEAFSSLFPSYKFDPIAIVAAFGNKQDFEALIQSGRIDIEKIRRHPVSPCHPFSYLAIYFENSDIISAFKKPEK